MKLIPALAAAAVLAMAGSATAQTSQTEANKQLVIRYFNALVQGDIPTIQALGRPDYIQHNPNFETGVDGMVKNIQARPPRPAGAPAPPPLQFFMVIAEGDKVMTLRRQPPAAGAPPEAVRAAIDIFRVQDGKVAEHWDYFETFPRGTTPPRNANGPF